MKFQFQSISTCLLVTIWVLLFATTMVIAQGELPAEPLSIEDFVKIRNDILIPELYYLDNIDLIIMADDSLLSEKEAFERSIFHTGEKSTSQHSVISEIGQGYSSTHNKWFKITKISGGYDSYENLISNIVFKTDPAANYWIVDHKYEYKYNAEGMLSVASFFVLYNGVWLQSRTLYTYDILDRVTEIYEQNQVDGEWIDYTKFLYTYNSRDSVINLTQVTGGPSGIFKPYKRSLYSFNEFNQLILHEKQKWENDQWAFKANTQYSYNSSGNLDYQYIKYWADTAWLPYGMYYYLRDENGSVTRTQYDKYNEETDAWVSLRIDTSAYDNNNNETFWARILYKGDSLGWLDWDKWELTYNTDNKISNWLIWRRINNELQQYNLYEYIYNDTTLEQINKYWNMQGEWVFKYRNIYTYDCGETHVDGQISILDIIDLIVDAFGDNPGLIPLYRTDVNGDGSLDILDVTYLVSNIYLGGPDLFCRLIE